MSEEGITDDEFSDIETKNDHLELIVSINNQLVKTINYIVKINNQLCLLVSNLNNVNFVLNTKVESLNNSLTDI